MEFLKCIKEKDFNMDCVCSDLIDLPENYTGEVWINNNNETLDFTINIDSKGLCEDMLTENKELTENLQEDFGNADIRRSWNNWIEKWLNEKGYTTEWLESGNTYNQDNYYFWGSVFEYVCFKNDNNDYGIVIMFHLKGDVRTNYAYPVVYFGDIEEYMLFQNICDPEEEIACLLGYLDNSDLQSDIKKFFDPLYDPVEDAVNQYVVKNNLSFDF